MRMNLTEPTSVLDQWTALVSFVMPFLVSVLVQTHWNETTKRLVAFVACVAATVVQLSLQGRLDAEHLFPTALATFTGSQVLYLHFFKPLGLTQPIEELTNSSAPDDGA
jgi:hypothetical protein